MSSSQALYEREEARVNDPNANENKRLVVYVHIRQKRFDLNDKAIATVGVLHPGPDANEATGNNPTPYFFVGVRVHQVSPLCLCPSFVVTRCVQ